MIFKCDHFRHIYIILREKKTRIFYILYKYVCRATLEHHLDNNAILDIISTYFSALVGYLCRALRISNQFLFGAGSSWPA